MRRKLLLVGSALTAIAWMLLRRRRRPLSEPRHQITLTVVRDKVWLMCSCGWDGEDAPSLDDALAGARDHDAAAMIRLDRGAGLEEIAPTLQPWKSLGMLRAGSEENSSHPA